jgi:hypothetical protein
LRYGSSISKVISSQMGDQQEIDTLELSNGDRTGGIALQAGVDQHDTTVGQSDLEGSYAQEPDSCAHVKPSGM